MNLLPYHVAIIGAGPAGLFGARELANLGVHVTIFNRDVKPGGLAEYGIYPDKFTMKEGLRKQFRQIMAHERIAYYGKITIGSPGDLTLNDVQAWGFDAVLVSAGAQGTKSLGLEGESLEGVYHAKDVVYFYNKLPPFSQKKFVFGKRCAIIGAGNVMVDIARHLIDVQKAQEVTAVVRRGPAEVNFRKDEIKHLAGYLDLGALEQEFKRVMPHLAAIHQDVEIGRKKILEVLPKADPITEEAVFHFAFLASPVAMHGVDGRLTALEVEENILQEKDGVVSALGTGKRRMIPMDTVIFAIGDKVDDGLGLPVQRNEFIKNSSPRFPVDGVSYETAVEGVFFGGWSRKASDGLVGYARRDGINAARAVYQYLQVKPSSGLSPESVLEKIRKLSKPVAAKEDIRQLEKMESAEAVKLGLDEYKFASNEEMLDAMGMTEIA